MTGADIIKGVLSGGATAPQDGAWLVFVSLVAQSCLAAGALLLIEFIVAKHRCVRDDNPAYLKTQKQTNAILRVLERQAAVLGQLEGRVQSLQKGRDSYLKDADDTLNMGRNFLG
jgi:hypothetical protein